MLTPVGNYSRLEYVLNQNRNRSSDVNQFLVTALYNLATLRCYHLLT